MPQVDLETLVSACAGGSMDRKVACEPQPDDDVGPNLPEQEDDDAETDEQIVPPDFPPESFWLSKDAEYDWFDRNAFFERKDSTKGNNNNLSHPPSNNNSQRFSMNLKSKAAIIGLPKPQKTNYADSKNRRHCKKVNGRLFPKRSGSVGIKSTDGSMIEPSSPKVSCMGRVRSKRDRKRRWRHHRHRSTSASAAAESSSMDRSVKPAAVERRKKTGFLASFKAMFRHGRRNKSSPESPPRRSSVARATRSFDYETASCDSLPRQSTESEPPGLGGMKRFVSGRRSGSWVGEHGIDVA